MCTPNHSWTRLLSILLTCMSWKTDHTPFPTPGDALPWGNCFVLAEWRGGWVKTSLQGAPGDGGGGRILNVKPQGGRGQSVSLVTWEHRCRRGGRGDFQGPTSSHSHSQWIFPASKHYVRGQINHRFINSHYFPDQQNLWLRSKLRTFEPHSEQSSDHINISSPNFDTPTLLLRHGVSRERGEGKGGVGSNQGGCVVIWTTNISRELELFNRRSFVVLRMPIVCEDCKNL